MDFPALDAPFKRIILPVFFASMKLSVQKANLCVFKVITNHLERRDIVVLCEVKVNFVLNVLKGDVLYLKKKNVDHLL